MNKEPEVNLFGDYAETDLDQPTNYSLRYAEDDTDEEDKPTSYFSTNLQEDTIKTYCTEGTPYETPFTVSTATSMTDLHVEDTKENYKFKKRDEIEEADGESEIITKDNKPKENVEQTPLMFSRSSSLGSLSGFEQHSVHDDRSSIISDFSHRTSGVMSPSELPDSPTQTIPNDLMTKMRQVQISTPVEKRENSDEDDDDMLAACISMGIQNNRYNKGRLEMSSIPDTVHVYCTEDTPADISPIGSQSNLSILSLSSVQEEVKNEKIDSSDDEKILDECIQSGIPKLHKKIVPPVNSIPFKQKSEKLSDKFNLYGTPSSSPVDSNHGNKIIVQRDDNFSLSEEEDIMLAQCIQSGMPKMYLRLSILMLILMFVTCNCERIKRDLSSVFDTFLKNNETIYDRLEGIFHIEQLQDNKHNIIGRRRHRKGQHMMTMLILGLMLMGSVLIPMGFQFLAVLGGKALILAKMALILSSIQGLKKIATNGVNYGLYHTPITDHSWHDRRHENNLHYPVYELPKNPASFYD